MNNATCAGTPNFTGYCATTIVGSTAGYQDGPSGLISHPSGIVVSPTGELFLSDLNNNAVRKIVYMTNGTCVGTPNFTGYCTTTLAGNGSSGYQDGLGTAARFHNPTGITRDDAGNLCVSDAENHRIRMITPDGTVTTIAGTGVIGMNNGPTHTATFHFPIGITLGADNYLYVGDYLNHVIRKISR